MCVNRRKRHGSHTATYIYINSSLCPLSRAGGVREEEAWGPRRRSVQASHAKAGRDIRRRDPLCDTTTTAPAMSALCSSSSCSPPSAPACRWWWWWCADEPSSEALFPPPPPPPPPPGEDTKPPPPAVLLLCRLVTEPGRGEPPGTEPSYSRYIILYYIIILLYKDGGRLL